MPDQFRNRGAVDRHDTDFPEPGENPEFTGEAVMPENNKPEERDQAQEIEQDEVDQDPGERQKRNQGDDKEDPLAA